MRIRFCAFIIFLTFIVIHPYQDFGKAIAEDKKGYTLEELISMASEKNPSVALFKANLEMSKGEVISDRAYRNPELEIFGGKGRPADSQDSRSEYSIAVGQPLEWPAKRFYRKKRGEAGVERVERDIDDFRLQLVLEVKRGFYQILFNKNGIEIAEDNLKIMDRLLKSAEIRVKAGEAPEFELVKAKVEMLKADKELKRARDMLITSMASLNVLLGNDLKTEFDIEGDFIPSGKRYSLETTLSYAMENHPQVLRAKKEAEAKGYGLEMEKASIFPDVTVKGFFNREIDKDSYGLGFSIPIPFWYQRKGEITKASAERAKAEAELFKTKVELSKAITEGYQDYKIALDQIDVFEKGLLEEAREALRIAELSYKEGESGLLDFLDSQRVYRQVQLDYNQARYEFSISVAELERLGGELR